MLPLGLMNRLALLLSLVNSWCCFRVLWELLLLPLPMLLAPNGLSPHSKPIVLTVRHRPGLEWGTWGNPQELNWFLPLIKPYATRRKRRYEANQVWLNTTFVSQGSQSWGKLAVKTWRVKTELIIISILHIIITTTSILNLSSKQLRQKYWRTKNA